VHVDHAGQHRAQTLGQLPPVLEVATIGLQGLAGGCFRRPVLCAATSSCGRTGCPGGCDLLGSGVRQPVPLPPAGRTAAALLPQPRRSCPLVVVPVDTDRAAGRAADSGYPTHVPHRRSGVRPMPHRRSGVRPVPHNAICNGWAGADASAVVSSSRASGPVGGHTDEDGSGWADVRAVGVRPPRPPRRWGRKAAEPAADTSHRSAAAVRGCCPGFRTPRDSAPHPAMACVRARPLQEPVAGAAAAGRM
jgi:hypothetical protein